MEAVQARVEHPTFETVWATLQEVAEQQREIDRIIKENTEQQAERKKEIDRMFTKLGEQMGGLHKSFGEIAEHMVGPGIAKRFNEMGFCFTEPPEPNFKIYDEHKKTRTEIDLLLTNEEFLVGIEVKARLGDKDIEHHRRRLEILREDADKTGDGRKILGGIAVAMMGKGDKEAILEAGFYPLEQSGDTMQIDLPQGFVPKEW